MICLLGVYSLMLWLENVLPSIFFVLHRIDAEQAH